MKYYQHCGSDLLKEDAAICTECGEHLPDKHEDEHLSEKIAKRDAALASPDGKKKHNWFRRKHRKPEAPICKFRPLSHACTDF